MAVICGRVLFPALHSKTKCRRVDVRDGTEKKVRLSGRCTLTRMDGGEHLSVHNNERARIRKATEP